MNNIERNNKFDAIIKGAATDYELPFNEDAWKLMQKKLDNNKRKKKRFGFWLFFLIILSGISTFAFFNLTTSNSNPKNITINNSDINKLDVKLSINQATSKTETTLNKTELANPKEIEEYKETKSFTKNDIATEINNKPRIVSERKLEVFNKSNEIDSRILITTKNKTNSKKIPYTKTIKKIVDNKKEMNANVSKSIINIEELKIQIQSANSLNDFEVKKGSTKPAEKKLKEIETIASNNTILKTVKLNTVSNLMHNRYVTDFEKLARENEAAIARVTKELEEKELLEEKKRQEEVVKYLLKVKEIKAPASRWYAMLGLANNIGYVSNPQIAQNSMQLGFMAGYNVSKHVSFQAGIISGKRNFNARKDQFNYQGPLVYDKYITNISADVSVIDIPITFRYQFSETENKGLFFTAGISSVFLNKENYNVNLRGTTRDFIKQNFENSASRFSMFNLSIGYQYLLNKYFNFLCEPYIQLPFNNIGEGSTKLSSIGLQIGGKYNFLRKKKK